MSTNLVPVSGGGPLAPIDPEEPEQKIPEVSDRSTGTILAGLSVFAVFFAGLGGWAATAPLSSAVMAPGIIKVEGNRQTIQHLDGGIIAEILVSEGDEVKVGQTLLRLDDTLAKSTYEIQLNQRDILKTREARLFAESADRDTIEFVPDLMERRRNDGSIDNLLRKEAELFRARRTQLQNQITVLSQRTEQIREQINGYQAQSVSLRDQLKFIREELSGTRELYSKGYAPKTRVLALERAAASLAGQLGEQQANIGRAQQQIVETEAQINQVKRDRYSEVSDGLREVESRLLDVEPRLRASYDALQRIEIKAPISGIIIGKAVSTVGGVIQRGEKLMDIVPVDAGLQVEAQLAPQDVDQVKAGMRAEINFTAYNQRIVPIIHGTVTRVSPDRFQDQRTGNAYYSVVLEVDKDELAATKNVRLQPGMPADVMIPIEARTALEYLMSPLTQSFNKAWREE